MCSHARKSDSSGWGMSITNHGSQLGISMTGVKTHLRGRAEYLMSQMVPRRLYIQLPFHSYGFFLKNNGISTHGFRNYISLKSKTLSP